MEFQITKNYTVTLFPLSHMQEFLNELTKYVIRKEKSPMKAVLDCVWLPSIPNE